MLKDYSPVIWPSHCGIVRSTLKSYVTVPVRPINCLIYNECFFPVSLGFPIKEYDGNTRFNLSAAGQGKGLGSQLKLNFQGVIEKYQKSTKGLGSTKLCPVLTNWL